MQYKNVLALYDCRSKQEYIYRTNRVQEIMGGSEILRSLFTDFFENTTDFKIKTDWQNGDVPENYLEYFNAGDNDAEIIYEGGGNLCVIFKDEETYKNVNRKFSREALEKAFNVSIISSSAPVTGDFIADRKRLYAENTLRKNTGAFYTPCNVLPFTQVDRVTFQPIVKKETAKQKQYTSESRCKKKKYDSIKEEKYSVFEREFDRMVDKGTDSLLAIIYIDGNNMGQKVKNVTDGKNDYTAGINALRNFSKKTNVDFVENPIKAITQKLETLHSNASDEKEKKKYLFRKIISGGDEITIVCNAHTVPEILETYFDKLTSESDNSACAGVAIFHSHAPFADVYKIAEECCEMGKKKSHLEENAGKNYIDFHYCHAGITNSLEAIRDIQEKNYTARPYEYSESWKEFLRLGKLLATKSSDSDKKILTRSDIKILGEAIVNGESYYKEEMRRIASRDKGGSLAELFENEDKIKKILFDISIVYDLWFAGEGNDTNEQN